MASEAEIQASASEAVAQDNVATKPDDVSQSEKAAENNMTKATELQNTEARASDTENVGDAPSPSSDSVDEGEYTGPDRDSSAEPSSSSDTASRNKDKDQRDSSQPPLPNEPLPDQPRLPNEPVPDTDPSAPPLPNEPVPEQPEDDGWEYHWNPNDQSYWFYNRFTGVWQQENPRVPGANGPAATTAVITTDSAAASDGDTKKALSNPASIAGGYNPAIHGSYDENAWYAQNFRAATDPSATAPSAEAMLQQYYQIQQTEQQDYVTAGFFNRRTGQWQTGDQGPERHSDEARARRQLRAYFDIDAAANMHDGRSLKAERAGKKPTRAELKMYKEKRRQKKEEKRRAWLRD